jgi:hypothetical protein
MQKVASDDHPKLWSDLKRGLLEELDNSVHTCCAHPEQSDRAVEKSLTKMIQDFSGDGAAEISRPECQ